jgi:hypothetical protein
MSERKKIAEALRELRARMEGFKHHGDDWTEEDMQAAERALLATQPEDVGETTSELWMADECLGMIREVLVKHIPMDGCPPMFYPEAIHNCIAMPKRAIMRATGADAETVATATEDELVQIILARHPTKEAENGL